MSISLIPARSIIALSGPKFLEKWLSLRCRTCSLLNITTMAFFPVDNNGFDWQFINWYFHHFTGAKGRDLLRSQ